MKYDGTNIDVLVEDWVRALIPGRSDIEGRVTGTVEGHALVAWTMPTSRSGPRLNEADRFQAPYPVDIRHLRFLRRGG